MRFSTMKIWIHETTMSQTYTTTCACSFSKWPKWARTHKYTYTNAPYTEMVVFCCWRCCYRRWYYYWRFPSIDKQPLAFNIHIHTHTTQQCLVLLSIEPKISHPQRKNNKIQQQRQRCVLYTYIHMHWYVKNMLYPEENENWNARRGAAALIWKLSTFPYENSLFQETMTTTTTTKKHSLAWLHERAYIFLVCARCECVVVE